MQKSLNKRQEIYWMPHEEVMLRRPSTVWKNLISFSEILTKNFEPKSCGKFSNSKTILRIDSARADARRDKPSFVRNSAEYHLNIKKRLR